MKKRFSILKIISLALVIIALLSVLLLGGAYLYVKKNINYSADEELFRRASAFESTVFYGKDYTGGEDYLPVKAELSGSLRKTYVPLSEVPKELIEGFISVEDHAFFEHSGVDYKRTAYAALNYLFGKEKRFGASTITQQVVKNISGDNEITVSRKLSEILRALHIEKTFEKEEILELYLNIVPMSGNIYGVSEAARLFFGKSISDLTLSECATLIGITNAPTAYSPYRDPKKCLEKRDSVLDIMKREGVITQEECTLAKTSELRVLPEGESEDRIDSWFVEGVIEEVSADLAEKYGISSSAARIMLLSGGYSVYTTMDIRAQGILEEYFENDESFERAKSLGADYSMVVLDSESADMIAVIGSAGKKRGNRLLDNSSVPHIPASALKPLAIYAPLIDEGLINWATVIDDTPISFKETDGEYKAYPKNSPDIYDGLTTVKDAIRLSKNTVSMKLASERTPELIYNFLKTKFKIDTLVYKETKNGRTLTDIGLAPMALGQLTRGISLKKLTECYTVFPSGGMLNNSRNYLYVKDYEGNTVLKNEKNSERIFKAETARIMNKLLSEVVSDGTARSLRLKEIVDTAGKTGTSSGNKDKMFIGYTPYFTAGIWCGSEKSSVSGLAPTPLSLWDEIMGELHNELLRKGELSSFNTEGLIYAPYCRDSGGIYSDNCLYDPRGDRMEYGYFAKDNIPKEDCTAHVLVNYDSLYKGISLGKCPEEYCSKVSLIKIPNRSFPTEIFITDSEYACRDIENSIKLPDSPELPYFYYSLPEGEYSGITNRKRQFNSVCPIHR